MAKLAIGIQGSLIVLSIFVELAEFLVQNRQRPATGRQYRRLPFHARKCVRENADGIVVAPLRLIEHGLVVHHFEASGGILTSLEEILFGMIELMHFAIDLRDAEIN